MARPALKVEVVSADREVWAGEAVQVIARTVEGDMGVLPGHEPVFALLVPSKVEIVTAQGRQEALYVDGGYISVADGRVSILAEEAYLGKEISVDDAQRELDGLMLKYQSGETTDAERHRIHMLKAQLAAATKASES
ncbi:F0F1 ATP synthase subunit epsilon [Tessaracoccus sp. OH4464_COT-324]|uniref:F0F1 ATP synthase subunit epsilon n=1 Tax=Tessaracoccus sp. OH4464_COT-324 TaxID=2491059 RepID=UPI000F62E4E2|nr:F0F1 ATP synthase subunit epsilon [Tessaracoccus sp. OH4464_COT-324]RRD47892.1 F0F1 ATP synthase subunit epsilon [Tessaracoccus sp. OH4464_COT-324]